MKLLHDCFTGIDNQTYDLGKVLIALTLLFYFILQAINYKTFNALSFSGGASGILCAGGILLKIKESTEPKPK